MRTAAPALTELRISRHSRRRSIRQSTAKSDGAPAKDDAGFFGPAGSWQGNGLRERGE
jgi:hypothetical protein